MPSGLRIIAPVAAAVIAAGGGATWLVVKDNPPAPQETTEPAIAEDLPEPDDGPSPPTSTAPPEGQPLRPADRMPDLISRGDYYAMSGTAMSITGDVHFEGDLITFANGQTITTRMIRTMPASETYSVSGRSWGDLLYVPAETRIELRQVVGKAINNNAQDLCGSMSVNWVGLGSKKNTEGTIVSVSMALLSGKAEPGPEAPGDNVCATYAYTG